MMRFLVFASLLFITACGFHPVYGVNKYTSVGVEEKLQHVEIPHIRDREGQVLRNALIDRFHREGLVDADYVLEISSIAERYINLDLTQTSDTTRAQLRLSAPYVLKDKRSGEVLFESLAQSFVSYNVLSGQFATRVSENYARENALNDLASQIERGIVLYFKRTQ